MVYQVIKMDYGIIVKKGSEEHHTRTNHSKYWKKKIGSEVIKDQDFVTELYPGVGDGYFDSDYAVPMGYNCEQDYK